MVALLLSCKGAVNTEEVAERPPNILLIMVDDLGKEWVTTYGAEDIVSPNIDRLAKAGTKLNNVYSMPQCTPTRVSILTGQYPFWHGGVNHWDVPRWGGGTHFDENLNPSLGKQMKKAGYKTCIVDKWQIDDFRVEPDALTKNGFDQYCMWTGYETGVPASAERHQDPYLYSNGETVRIIEENPYMQFFFGLKEFFPESLFSPSLFVEWRKKLGNGVFNDFFRTYR